MEYATEYLIVIHGVAHEFFRGTVHGKLLGKPHGLPMEYP